MMTLFDYGTVACFLGTVIAFFTLTNREPRTLFHMLIPGLLFAAGNQLGNRGMTVFALVLIAAGIGYSVLVIRGARA